MPVYYNSMYTIDINCDLGEGFPQDTQLMSYISSANIACGYHAGDNDTIKRTIDLCLIEEVAIGAHPGFKDKANFGRTDMFLEDSEIFDLVAEQIVLMQDHCRREGCLLHHVKPHGALYNMAAINKGMSYTIASVIKELDPSLYLYGMSNSHLVKEAKKLGIKTVSEVFADRRYDSNGTLIPRTRFDALIHTSEDALEQSLQMIQNKTVTVINAFYRLDIPILAETICIHGDGENAVELAKTIHQGFTKNSIHLKFPGE